MVLDDFRLGRGQISGIVRRRWVKKEGIRMATERMKMGIKTRKRNEVIRERPQMKSEALQELLIASLRCLTMSNGSNSPGHSPEMENMRLCRKEPDTRQR
jgi:hypothetical protein